MSKIKRKIFKSPYIVIVLSFVMVILIGTLLLWLPISANEGQELSFTDALFFSTSAICVTGLSPVANPGATLSVFGKIVLTLLIQIGGLGLVTIAVYVMMVLGVRIGIEERQIVKETYNQSSMSGLLRFVKRVIFITLAIEGFGAIMNMLVFLPEFDFWTALGYSIFHSVSAFNNCGFDLLGDTSFIGYSSHILMNINLIMLIALGGIGFIVINEFITKRFKVKKLSIHTKLVLIMSMVLWIGGAILIKLLEGDNMTALQSLFLSVSSRTAGFATTDMSQLNTGTVLVVIFLMIVGGAPCGTAGGIKVTALYAMIKSIWGYARGKRPTAFGRAISERSILKAYILFTVAVMVLFTVVFLLTLLEPSASFIALVFEAVSAFATVGFSMGLTPTLCVASKLLLVPLMFFGRLGALTIIALIYKRSQAANKVGLVEEKLIIG